MGRNTVATDTTDEAATLNVTMRPAIHHTMRRATSSANAVTGMATATTAIHMVIVVAEIAVITAIATKQSIISTKFKTLGRY